jgi:hypothetical protein
MQDESALLQDAQESHDATRPDQFDFCLSNEPAIRLSQLPVAALPPVINILQQIREWQVPMAMGKSNRSR